MAVDVQRVVEQYEERAVAMPMHGQRGEVRRNPSTDQKRERRQMKRAELQALPERELLALASHRHVSDEERAELLAVVEFKRTAAWRERDANLDAVIAGAQIRNDVTPGYVHDRSTAASDWLGELPQHTAELGEITHEMVAEASLWFARVPDFVRADGAECAEQAKGRAHRLASRHGSLTGSQDVYEAARMAFLGQAERLWHNSANAGQFTKEAIWPALIPLAEVAADAVAGGAAAEAGGAAAAGAGEAAAAGAGEAAAGAGEAGAATGAGEGGAAARGLSDSAKNWADNIGGKVVRHEIHHPGGTDDSHTDESAPEAPQGSDMTGKAYDFANQVTSGLHHVAEYWRDLDGPDPQRVPGTPPGVPNPFEGLPGHEPRPAGDPFGFGEDPFATPQSRAEDAARAERWKQLRHDNMTPGQRMREKVRDKAAPIVERGLNRLIFGPGGPNAADPTAATPPAAGATAPAAPVRPAHPGHLPADHPDSTQPAPQRDWSWHGPKPFNDLVRDHASGRPSQGIQYAWHHSSLDPKVASAMSQLDVDIDTIFNSKLAASGVPQVGEQGLPTEAFAQSGYPDMDTSSDRSPVLQELAGNQGLSDPSLNAGQQAGDDAAFGSAQGFPVSGSAQRADAILARTAHKENRMEHTATGQCPSCSGTGKVAVRQVTAYSGLPQIDQIVNADETAQPTQLPTDVAFPMTWDVNSVPNAINQTEQFISDRNSKSPLMAQGAAQDTSGYDSSGWASNAPQTPAPGGKGQRYPGYSAPTGYDGSDEAGGYADPVYGYGGDSEGTRQVSPRGAQEVNDETNVPHQQYGPTGPYNNDEGWREVGNGMSTQGSRDPYIAAAQAEILRQQQIIRSRMGR